MFVQCNVYHFVRCLSTSQMYVLKTAHPYTKRLQMSIPL